MMDKLNGRIFLIEDYDLLEKCNTIWDKSSADIKKILIANLSVRKKKLKNKIKSHRDEVTDFYDKEKNVVKESHRLKNLILSFYIVPFSRCMKS